MLKKIMFNIMRGGLREEKTSDMYLSLIDGNIDEKIGYIVEVLAKRHAPADKKGIVTVLECGIGGGSQLRKIAEYMPCNGRLIAMDILDLSYRASGFMFLRSDMCNINLPDSSVSVANLSAILHEVYSYHKYQSIKSVDKSLSEIARVLLPGGYCAYRDLGYPDNADDMISITYKGRHIVFFYHFFLKDFVYNTHAYEVASYGCEERADSVTLTMSKLLHMEFQRHYLSFREVVRGGFLAELGISSLRHRWISKQDGIKEFFLEDTTGIFNPVARVYNLMYCPLLSREGKRVYRMRGTQFDIFLDSVIADYAQKSRLFMTYIERWKEREGKEMYYYYSLEQIIRKGIELEGDYILFPAHSDAVKKITRHYYTRYLSTIATHGMRDYKQLILWQKMTPERALTLLDKGILQGHISPDVQAEYRKILMSRMGSG